MIGKVGIEVFSGYGDFEDYECFFDKIGNEYLLVFVFSIS